MRYIHSAGMCGMQTGTPVIFVLPVQTLFPNILLSHRQSPCVCMPACPHGTVVSSGILLPFSPNGHLLGAIPLLCYIGEMLAANTDSFLPSEAMLNSIVNFSCHIESPAEVRGNPACMSDCPVS